MKVKKVKMIKESEGNIVFANSTEDQFPYVAETLNILDRNYNWWKKNYANLEQLIAEALQKSLTFNGKGKDVTISSRFTIFHGNDDEVKDVIWTGPAIVYTFEGADNKTIEGVKTLLGGENKGEMDGSEYTKKSNLFEGHRMFVFENQLVILFG